MIRAVKVTPHDDHSVSVQLENGRAIRFKMDFIFSESGPVVDPLKSIAEFKKAFIRNGIVKWLSGYDIDPYYLIEKGTPEELTA